MKILIIEDEAKAAAFLEKGLVEHGYVVDTAPDGEEGLAYARSREYDLIILDVMMPRLDGWSVMRQLRQDGSTAMTLFLTARDSLQDRVHGLNLGADAYLVKPFAFTELLALVRTLLRRSNSRATPVIQIADLEIDLLQHRVTREGQRIELTPKEFLLLTLMARRKGEVLSRTLIAEQVWNINFDSETNVVDVHLGRLRSKIDSPFQHKLIRTVRGMGYVLDDQP